MLSNVEIKRAILTMDEQEDLPKDMLEQVGTDPAAELEISQEHGDGTREPGMEILELCRTLIAGNCSPDQPAHSSGIV